jgi:hypothetical protein
MIAKTFKTYVSPGNLGLSLGKVHCSSGKLHFSPRNNHVSRDKEFSFALGSNLNIFYLENNHFPRDELKLELFFPQEHGCSLRQHKPYSFMNMGVPWGTI